MSVPENSNEFANNERFTVHLTNGEGFAWDETIEGIVTVYPHPTEVRTFSTISVGIVEQDEDGFISPMSFAGGRDPFNPLGETILGSEFNTFTLASTEVDLEEITIARDITVTPGDIPQEIPFLVPVPRGVPLTALCFIAARATATDGVDNDQHTAVPFIILPPLGIQAIQNALKTFGDFELVESDSAPGEHIGEYRFTLDYVAPEPLQYALDGIKFELIETNTEIKGITEINPQEHTLADHLRAFIHADRIRVPVSFERSELDAAGKANLPSDTVKERLHELLDGFIHPIAA